MALEYVSNMSEQSVAAQTLVESADESHSNIKESILIVGGYDGVSWSSALQSFLPSKDILRSLKPMSSARWNAPIVKFNEDLYVFGGGSGSKWYDTGTINAGFLSLFCSFISLHLHIILSLSAVESYNIVNNEWTLCPSLIKRRGSLAGAALNNKIYAIGGGNGVEFFSDVEMFDPYLGRWIPSRSMLQKVLFYSVLVWYFIN